MPTYNKAVINGTTYLDLSSDTVTANSMLDGVTAHDKNGATVTGNIPSLSFPASAQSSATSGYTGAGSMTIATADRYINIPAGYYGTASWYRFRGVVTSGIQAKNIKDGAVISVGDTGNATRIANMTGTFTDASTVSSGQTAATASEIMQGYSAWVDGVEVQGTATGGATCEFRNGGATWAQAVAGASTSVGWREEKYSDGRLIRFAWDFWNANAGDGAKTVAMTAKASDNAGPTAFTDTPECFFFQRSTGSTAVSASITLQSWSNTTHTYYMFFSNNGSNRRIAVSTRMEGHWK